MDDRNLYERRLGKERGRQQDGWRPRRRAFRDLTTEKNPFFRFALRQMEAPFLRCREARRYESGKILSM